MSTLEAQSPRTIHRRRPPLTSMFPIVVVTLALHTPSVRAAETSPPASGPRRAASPPTCPSLDFSRFLDSFAENVDVQVAFTRFPLVKRSIDPAADPEPRSVEKQVRLEDVAVPLFPSEQARKRQRLRLKVRALSAAANEALVWEGDTGHQVVFRFEKSDCWRLVLVDDQSL